MDNKNNSIDDTVEIIEYVLNAKSGNYSGR